MILLIYNDLLLNASANSILKLFRNIKYYRNDILEFKITFNNILSNKEYLTKIQNIIKNNNIKLIFCVWAYLSKNQEKNIINILEGLNLNIKILCHTHDFFRNLPKYHNLKKTKRYIEIGFYDQINAFSIPSNIIYPVMHCATNNFLKELNSNPINKILLSGRIVNIYPQRQEFYNYAIKNEKKIYIKQHPGYFNKDDNYSNILNDYIACYYSSIHIPKLENNLVILAKAFEIPATGSLLLADESCKDSLKKVGFEENINYMTINKNNYDKTIDFILDEKNRVIINEIRRNGQKLILENHTELARVKEINEILDKIIEEPN